MEDKIKQIKQKVEEINKELDDLIHSNGDNEEKMDFSKWIGRNRDDLCIFGKKMLQSVKSAKFHDGEISVQYDNINRVDYNDSVEYEVIEEKDLKYGDIFIDDIIKNPRLEHFEIYIGKDENYIYVQFLYQTRGVELIESLPCIKTNLKVKRFLRE